MNAGIITLIVVLVIIAAIALYLVTTHNSLVGSKNTVEEAFSTMDVYLKKRWDLIPNLLEVVKGYAKHEKETFAEIVKMRNTPYNTMNTNEKIEANNELSKSISKLFALAENYPELKADTQFTNLSNNLSGIEEEIASSRKYYNGAVKNHNNKVQMFPSNVVAKMFKFETYKMFETAEQERQNVKVQF